jgi:hypothetical protein
MIGTSIWKYGCEEENRNVWHSIFETFKRGKVIEMHAMLAQNLIAEGCVNCSQEIVAICIAVVPILDGAKMGHNARLCITLCELISTLMSNPTFVGFLTSLRHCLVLIRILVKDNFSQEILNMFVANKMSARGIPGL